MPKVCTYPHEGYTIEEFKFTYNNYVYHFECFFTVSDYVCTLESYNDDEPVYFVRHASKLKALNLMKKWLKMSDARDFYLREFKVSPEFPDILLSVREKRIGYHIASSKNAERILREGLIPNGVLNNEVYISAQMLDEIRPSSVPDNIYRAQSVYAYPVFDNYLLSSEREDMVLLALQLPEVPMWVSDQGWAGLCLVFDEWDEKQLKKHKSYVRRDVGKKYWKHSMSLCDYIESNKDYDEILITGSVPASNITLIGSWDDDGVFTTSEDFTRFVKDEHKSTYTDILSKYVK